VEEDMLAACHCKKEKEKEKKKKNPSNTKINSRI
jgi:hypothetical protein